MPPTTHYRDAWEDPGDWEQRSSSMLFSPSTKSIINMTSAYCSSRTLCPDDTPYKVGTTSMTLNAIYKCKPFPVVTMTLSAAYYDSAFFGSEIHGHIDYLLRSRQIANGNVTRFGGGFISAMTIPCLA